MFTMFDARSSVQDLDRRIEQADRVTPALSKALVAASERLRTLERQGKTERLDRLVADGAWTEMAFELLALAAPEWTLGRLCRTDGEWLCTLTLHPDMPEWLDDSIEVRHRSRELALLGAVGAAMRRRDVAGAIPEPRAGDLGRVPQYR